MIQPPPAKNEIIPGVGGKSLTEAFDSFLGITDSIREQKGR